MDNLNSLSDEELRLELVKYGFPNMPVTFTTRKILIKKLRRHLDEQKQKLRRESSAVLRYSSSEESDSGEGRKVTAAQRKSYAAPNSSTPGAAKRLGRSQRATVAGGGPAVPPPAVSSMPPPSVGPIKRTLLNSSISSPGSSSQHSFSNHGNSPFLGANGASGGGGGGGKKSSHSPSQIYVSPVLRHDHDEEDHSPTAPWGSPRPYGCNPSPYHSSLFRKTALAAHNITPPTASSSMYSNNNNNSASSSNNNSALLNDSNASNGSSGAGSAGGDSPPYVSEYTRRLMQLRGETVSQENYNSAIGGIIGRRSSPGGGIIPPSRYSTAVPSPATNPMAHNTRVPIHPLHYRSIAGHFKLGLTGGPAAPSPPSPLVAGNHIRQRYSRVLGGQQHELDENDIVTHAQPSPEPPAIPFRVAIGNLITKLDEHYGFKQTFVPCALLCLLVAFLVSVALMYMTISTDLASTLSSIDTRYDLCDDGRNAAVLSGTDCVLTADVEPALELLKLVGSELKQRVEAYHCRRDPAAASAGGIETSSSVASSIMSPGEVLKKAKEHSPSVLIPQLTRHLHAMEYLIDRNPQWRIDHCDADGQPITFAEVVERRPVKANHYTILKPKLPFGCMLYNKFQKFFVIVGGLALTALLAFVANYLYKFVVYVKQKRREQVSGLISEILHAVSQAAATASEAAMVANGAAAPGTTVPDARVVVMHLRDRLLAPVNRRKLGWAWNEAIQFLEQNESRIAFEVGSVGGEDFKMMRWIDTAPLATSTVNVGSTAAATARISGGPGGAASCAKKWQSPAFDNSNKILDPPTPCLKIRQMFDRYEVNDPNLKTIVQDAILEKVGGRCKIYDIQLDRSSCCVYVRCASAKDAGIVHDEINGWWFDNRLVSIKFLRLERYLQRFPGSLSGSVCLKPSNKNNFSMSHQLAAGGGGVGGGANGRGGVRSVNEDYDTEPEPEDDDEDDDDDDEELVAAADAMDGPSIGIHGRRSASRRGREEDGEEDEPEEDDEE
ncbi:uncharacterized protein LOC128277376 [Anopheles cruzii]|uniref:uncharacterized protein LOC128277376 n=1 Tax=Anopheles cruzii TaxID=68878 RepID=UPI0022EC46B4|nr:uncharacterized protein LOC128277376 [Anopheles cruzii]